MTVVSRYGGSNVKHVNHILSAIAIGGKWKGLTFDVVCSRSIARLEHMVRDSDGTSRAVSIISHQS